MRLFGWFRPAPQNQTETARPPQRWSWFAGRRLLSFGAYIFPKDLAEGNRLDLQHHLIKLSLGGNYRAPVRQPRAILDVACGTGIWGREMAQEFPQAQVISFDVDPTPMEASLKRLGTAGQFPSNFRFMEANALKPFPFEDEYFDFTHARLISPFAPIALWPKIVAEMVRVTRPGGYIEIMESELSNCSSPAFKVLTDMTVQLLSKHGLHVGAAPHVIGYLTQAGLERVQQRHIVLGTGRFAHRQQRLLLADLVAGAENMRPIAVKSGLITDAQYGALYEQMKREMPQSTITWPYICTYGMKPFKTKGQSYLAGAFDSHQPV
jgi:ubiquinone/menaquinone biosynthesis C-methylase UbiE